jgi:hypothetical protein
MAPLELLRQVGGHRDGYSPKNKWTRCRSLRDSAVQVNQDVEFLVVGLIESWEVETNSDGGVL